MRPEVYPSLGQRVGEAEKSTTDCAETAGATQVGGGVVGGFVGGVLVTLVLAVIVFVAVGWKWLVENLGTNIIIVLYVTIVWFTQ